MGIHIMCYITGGSDDGLGEGAVAAIVTIVVLVVVSAVGVCVVITIFYFKRKRTGNRNFTTFVINIIKKKYRTSQPTSNSIVKCCLCSLKVTNQDCYNCFQLSADGHQLQGLLLLS